MKKNKILIVEDEKIVAIDIRRRIEQLGYEVVSVERTGEEAIVKAAELLPDLVLMDIVLAGIMDGVEAAEKIKEANGIPIIFLTAFSEESSFTRAKTIEPSAYLIKPFDVKELKFTIELALYKSKTEKQLRENELWVTTTLNSIYEGVITVDQFEIIKYFNPAAEKLTGFKKEDAIGKKLSDVYNITDNTSYEYLVTSIFNYSKKIQSLISNNKLLIKSSREILHIEETRAAIADKYSYQGQVITFRDLTSKIEAELQIVASRDYYLHLFEEFPTPIWRANSDGQFNYFNKTWLEATGRTLEDEIFKGWMLRLNNEDRERFELIFTEAMRSKNSFYTEFRLLDNKNIYKWFICQANPIFDLKRNFTGFIGVCFDITNRKAMEDELKSAKEESDNASRIKSSFISNMSHEIRTPLTGIVGLTDLMLESEMSVEQNEYMQMLKQSSNTLMGLLENLLDFAKIDDAKAKYEEQEFNLLTAIQDILIPYEIQSAKENVMLVKDIAESVPEIVYSDKKKIVQIISNLVNNAYKFTAKGNITIKVFSEDFINSEKKNTHTSIHFVISDTGIGIPKEKIGQIFDSFTQVDNSHTKKYSGIGLGLSIAKRYVEALGGKIWVHSNIEQGSSFHFIVKVRTEKQNYIKL